jgi:hypothetical protein
MSTDIECSGNNSPEVYDQQGNPLTPTPQKIDLRDAAAIRRELGSVYRDMRAGRIETADGTKLAYVLDAIRKAFEAEVLAARLEIFERTLRK